MTEEQRKLQEQTQQQNNTPAPAVQQPQQDTQAQQAADASYNQAMGALQAAGKPTYNASYDAQIQDIYNQIMGRDDFSYDLNEDALFDLYRQNYTEQGKLAMRDTIGQAAALTGGYGSSYGQAVGQQAYDRYLQGLNDIVPELYGQAYQRYADEGDRLSRMYNLALGEKDRFYAEQDYNYARLMELLNATGYEPTAEEAAAAGLTEDQVQQLLKAWRIQNPGLYNQMNGRGQVYSGRSGNGEEPEEEPKNDLNLLLEDDKLGAVGTYEKLYQQEYDRLMSRASPSTGERAAKAAQSAAAQHALEEMINRGYTAEQISQFLKP